MKKFKISLFSIFLIVNLLVINMGSHRFVFSEKSNTNKVISKNDFIKKVTSNEIFKEFENILVSKEPKILNDMKDENENTIGYVTQYEIYKNKKEKIDIKSNKINPTSKKVAFIDIETETTSTLTFLYRFSEEEMEVFMVDYSNLANNKINLIDLKNCKLENFEISKNSLLFKHAEELRQLKTSIINNAKKQLKMNWHRPSGCAWWTCTKYETVGGYNSEKCEKYLGWACDGASVAKKIKFWGWAACKVGTLIACYVPKTRHCVSGYWETRVCPIKP